MKIGTIVLLVLLVVLIGYPITIFNSLVRHRHRVKNAFAQIDVQLKRRYDLIPNLVEIAKAYLKHEQDTLESVIQARNQAQSAAQRVRTDSRQNTAMANLIQADNTLNHSLERLFMVMESYPDLKANQHMSQLHEELTATENKVGFARQAYNDAVMSYNIERESFPNILLANLFLFQEATSWSIEDPAERENIRVSFASQNPDNRSRHPSASYKSSQSP